MRQLERAMGIEPTTPTLARSCSTAELHPHPVRRPDLCNKARRLASKLPTQPLHGEGSPV